MKPRVLYYTDCYLFGGCERPLYELLSAGKLAQQCDYLLVCRKNRKYQAGAMAHYPAIARRIKWVELPDICTLDELFGWPLASVLNLAYRFIWPLFFFYDLIVLYWLFRREPAELIHINNGGYPGALSCRAAALAARLAGKKRTIFNVHNTAQKIESPLNRLVDLLVNKWTSVFVTGSLASRQALIKNRRIDAAKVVNIYHGIDRPGVTAGQKRELITMVAGFEERKGHRIVIAALGKIIADHPGIKIVFIGDGPLLDEMKKIAIKAGLEKNVSFLGRRPDYLTWVNESRFLLNPSLANEDLPYIILEAMALGVSVIGTAVAGIPEEIEHNVSGLVVAPGNVDQLAAAIWQLLADEPLCWRLGEAARERFEKMFTKQRMIANYLELYRRINK